MVPSKRKPIDDLQKTTNNKIARMSVSYSNSMVDAVKTFCCECDKVVTLTGLDEHILTHNKMTVKKYKQLYGNPRTQIIQLVYHRCELCAEDVLMDFSIMEKHVRSFHQMKFAEYCSKYLSAPQENNPVIIRCHQCSKTFKRNIQLKAHSKRHDMSHTDEVGFHGFRSIEPMKKEQHLTELINTFETSIHREKQAFQQLLKLAY